jgi:ATP-dependent exoDNAse (exonuclease V) beta subunit
MTIQMTYLLLQFSKQIFFAINDTELFKIASFSNSGDVQGKNTFWDKLCRYVLSNNASDAAKRAFNILTDIIPASRRIAISGLVDLITENTAWYATINHHTNAEQKIANVKKLKSFTISYESRGFKSLYDLVNEFQMLSESSKEGEASYIKEKNAVNLMTIHMSKGLEFPVVILYRLNSKSGNNSITFDIDKDYGMFFKYNNINDKENTIISNFIDYKLKQADDAEEKRVLYVAMTRAKYRLCLSIFVSFNKDGKTGKPLGLAKLFYDAFDELGDITSDNINEFSQIMSMNIKCLNSAISFDNSKYYAKAFQTQEKQVSEDYVSEKESKAEPMLLMDKIQRKYSKELFSPTKIQLWNREKEFPDEMQYVKRYLLGLNEKDKFFIHSSTDEENTFGTEAGTVIHSVLEDMRNWISPDGNPDNKKLTSYVEHKLNQHNINKSNLFDRVMTDIRSVMASSFIRERLSDILKSKFEYKLSLAVDNDILEGTIDLLFIDKSGNYEVWDWKSNYIKNDGEKDIKISNLRNTYEYQMKLYCYFIYKIKPEQKIFKAKLLLTRMCVFSSDNKDWLIEYEWNSEELEIFGENIKKVIKEIKENSIYSRYINSKN